MKTLFRLRPGRKTKLFLGGCLFVFTFAVGCSSVPEDGKPELTKRDRARMMIEIANGALTEGDATGALQHLVKAQKLDDQLPELYHSKGLAYFLKHDRKRAIEEVQKALELKPIYAEANNTLGKLLMDENRYTEAKKYLNVAANDALYRDAYKPWTSLGLIAYREGDQKKSRSLLNRAVEESPALSCVAYYYLGHLDLKEGNTPGAIENYSKATDKFCADFAEASLALGMAYQKNRQFSQAKKLFTDIQKRYPHSKVAKKAVRQLKYLP